MLAQPYNYRSAVKEDIMAYLEENWPKGKPITDDDYEGLHDDMFGSDEVTGNGSGSYTFNRWVAEEMVCHNLTLLGNAIGHFCMSGGEIREKLDGEWADVTIRCYLLEMHLDEVIHDWNERAKEMKDCI